MLLWFIHNSINIPYYLKEKYKGISANNIYVRLQDSNTPVDKSADFHHVEYLWKKRFGVLLSPFLLRFYYYTWV